jgi:hypothetical protein
MPFHLSKNGTAKAALYILQRLPPCGRSLAASDCELLERLAAI